MIRAFSLATNRASNGTVVEARKNRRTRIGVEEEAVGKSCFRVLSSAECCVCVVYDRRRIWLSGLIVEVARGLVRPK